MKLLAAGALWVVVAATAAAGSTLVPSGADWRYLDSGSGLPFDWVEPAFVDAGWSVGRAPLGYGDPGLWPVGFGPDPASKIITTYFRRSFRVADPTVYQRLTVRLRRDDGAVVYLNGAEVFRSNIRGRLIRARRRAASAVEGDEETAFFSKEVDPRLLLAGKNVVAVEVHQRSAGSPDLAFDLELSGTPWAAGAARLTRGPYLQRATPHEVLVRWRTDIVSDSMVSFGTEPGSLLDSRSDPVVTKEHEVLLSGLQADTTYFYSIGSTGAVLAGGDEITYFTTPPLAGTARPIRLWVIGDSGTCAPPETAAWCPLARAVRNAFLSYSAGLRTDAWLMLGDNAYISGTQREYQKAVFDTYPSLLRRAVVWPTPGNHEERTSHSGPRSGPYFDVFSLPAGGEAGGVASGTEAYYSFDLGNIHFVVLDSGGTDRTPPSAMLDWLTADLASTSSDWLIAYWHHPPYSKGSHDSDAPHPPTSIELAEMRANVLPILEAWGVDLVLSGHSHSYERSVLLDSHYLDSTTLTSANKKDAGAGHPGHPYVKPGCLPGRAPNEGAVYAVVGSSGLLAPRIGVHPAMAVTLDRMGSLSVEVDHNVLEAVFLDEGRVIRDRFTIIKGCRGNARARARAATGR